MAVALVDEIYKQVQTLPVEVRLQLVERITHDLATQGADGQPKKRRLWSEIRGIAPNLLGGEDAQEWVSRTRREGDEHREKQLKRES